MKNSLLGLAVIASIVAVGAVAYHRHAGSAPEVEADLATPLGVTFQPAALAKGFAVTGMVGDMTGNRIAYGDDARRFFYIYDGDANGGKSPCVDACAKDWIPAAPVAGAVPLKDWSIVTRADGGKQWAFRGNPLYVSAKDHGEQIPSRDPVVIMAMPRPPVVAEHWHMAIRDPGEGVATPPDISVQEVSAAPGEVLVNARGLALYSYDGEVKDGPASCASGPCGTDWVPYSTGELANPVGDFTIISRNDGIRQWAYRGHPLFGYAGDFQTGDANGKDRDPKFHPALVKRYFMPAGVTVLPNQRKGGMLATASGSTLYATDRFRFDGVAGEHSSRNGDRGIVSVGIAIGPKGCAGDCLKRWHPLTAPADAQPSGYWSLTAREDGSRQWAYQGYALYTFDGDRRRGDDIAQDTYLLRDTTKLAADDGMGFGLYWRTTPP